MIELDNGTHNIALNTFGGSAQSVSVTDAGAITTGVAGTNVDAFTLNGTSVTLSEAITASGATSITATTGALAINGAYSGTTVGLTAGAAGLTQTASLTTTGLLTVNLGTGGGTANLTGVATNNVNSLAGTGNSGTIELDNGTHAIVLNTFGGSGQSVSVTDAGVITTVATGTSVDELTLSGTSVTLSEAITASGATSITAGTGVIAINAAYSGTTVGLTAGSAGVTQTASLTTTGLLTVNLGASGGTANLTGVATNNVNSLAGTGNSGTIELDNGTHAIQLNTFGGAGQTVSVTDAGVITTAAGSTSVAALTLSGTSVTLSEAITASGAQHHS